MDLSVAIVGSGPAACYTAERLARDATIAIDVLERLPVPHGLIRHGVAADHQGTKAVARIFDRVFARPQVAFFGDVELGSAVALAELRRLYDAVVIATGAAAERRLEIPGASLDGALGSRDLVSWLNAHPERDAAAPPLARARVAVVIGNGNVALDVARVLAKSPAELAAADLAPDVAAALAAAPLERIEIVGRRSAGETAFSAAELGELGALARAAPLVAEDDLAQPPAANAPALALLRGFAARGGGGKPVEIRFRFGLTPLAMEGSRRLERVVFARGEERVALAADLAVACIGYRLESSHGLPASDRAVANDAGRVDDGLWAVGWAKRGPTGTIPATRAEAHAVAERLLAETAPRGGGGRAALRALLAARGARIVDWAGWRRIDAAERARAVAPRPRHKFARLAELRAAAGGGDGLARATG